MERFGDAAQNQPATKFLKARERQIPLTSISSSIEDMAEQIKKRHDELKKSEGKGRNQVLVRSQESPPLLSKEGKLQISEYVDQPIKTEN